MQLSGVQAAALLLAVAVFGLLGTMNGLANSAATANSNRLNEVALSYAEAMASNVKSGGSVASDSFTVVDNRLGSVSVSVSGTASSIIVTASVQGVSRTVQVDAQ